MDLGAGFPLPKLTTTVVITTFNRPHYLLQSVRSVLAQSLPADQLVVVDDGSNLPLPKLPPTVEIIRTDNNGLAAARNRGLDAAIGDVVFFLDDDDIWSPRRIELSIPIHNAFPIVVCNQASFNDSSGPSPVLDSASKEMEEEPSRWTAGSSRSKPIHRVVRLTTPSFGATSILRTSAQRFDDSWAASQDVDWWLRLASSRPQLEVGVVDHRGLFVRHHDGERFLNGERARYAASTRILEEHREYLRRHRRTKAFREYRCAVYAARLGDSEVARRACTSSLLSMPSVRSATLLIQSLMRKA